MGLSISFEFFQVLTAKVVIKGYKLGASGRVRKMISKTMTDVGYKSPDSTLERGRLLEN